MNSFIAASSRASFTGRGLRKDRGDLEKESPIITFVLRTYRAMALPYPEGEVFFKRSVLNNNGNDLGADDLDCFDSKTLMK